MPVVLIIDDSPTEVHVLKSALEQNGYSTLSADNGRAGVELAREALPDLILMDVVMPGLNGYQATRRLHKDPATSAIPVIMVTTKSHETDRIWGMRQGAVDYIVKPVDTVELMERARAALAA
ncbi:MAG: response regulator transcription factor [Gammaproteobacteria bacterium]